MRDGYQGVRLAPCAVYYAFIRDGLPLCPITGPKTRSIVALRVRGTRPTWCMRHSKWACPKAGTNRTIFSTEGDAKANAWAPPRERGLRLTVVLWRVITVARSASWPADQLETGAPSYAAPGMPVGVPKQNRRPNSYRSGGTYRWE